MRDEALGEAGNDGPTYTIDNVDTDWNTEDIAFRINGTFTASLYLDKPEPGSRLMFGDDKMPEPDSAKPTYQVPFELIIPQSALTTPAKLVQYGHGLLGEKEQIESGHFRTFMNEYNYAFFAVDSDRHGFRGRESHRARFSGGRRTPTARDVRPHASGLSEQPAGDAHDEERVQQGRDVRSIHQS